MTEKIRFDENVEIAISGSVEVEPEVLDELGFVLDVDHEDGVATGCRIDLERLVNSLLIYNSTTHRFGWRR